MILMTKNRKSSISQRNLAASVRAPCRHPEIIGRYSDARHLALVNNETMYNVAMKNCIGSGSDACGVATIR